MDQHWPIRLFKKSVLKQRKFKELTEYLGATDKLNCLDVGSDNGVISYLLRERGGRWTSADLTEEAVFCIRELVKEHAFQINGRRTPFHDNEFDRVIIVDFLEHISTDKEFAEELHRIIKPDGELIINVPHIKNTLLRKFRVAIGQTDEKHGHVRPGYTPAGLGELLGRRFTIVSHKTYSKFFSESIDALMALVIGVLKGKNANSQKGLVVTGQDLQRYQRIFGLYCIIYPVVWLCSKLDLLLFFISGYMLIVKAKAVKRPAG